MSINTSKSFGKIDIAGAIKNLQTHSVSEENALNELYSNSIDANADKSITIIEQDSIIIADNGNGMNHDDIDNMFNLFKSNHGSDKSIGKAGLGFKFSGPELSKKKKMTIYTKKRGINSKFICIKVNWEKIFKDEVWIDEIKEDKSEPCPEIFKKYLNGSSHGTIIQFPYSDSVFGTIKKMFNTSDENIQEKNSISKQEGIEYLCNAPHVIYAYKNIHFEIRNKKDKTTIEDYEMYKVFNDNGEDVYLTPLMEQSIEIYKDRSESIRCVTEYNNKYVEFAPFGKGKTHKKIQDYTREHFEKLKSKDHWEEITTVTYRCGMKYDKNYFDPNNPREPYNDGNYIIGADNIANMKHYKEHLSRLRIKRNDHITGFGDIIGEQSSRGNWKSNMKSRHMRHELEYTTYSSQDSDIDRILNITANKQNFKFKLLPLIRIIEYLFNEKHKDICEYISSLIDEQQIKAIIKIQCIVRMFLAKKKVKQLQLEEEIQKMVYNGVEDNMCILDGLTIEEVINNDVEITQESSSALQEESTALTSQEASVAEPITYESAEEEPITYESAEEEPITYKSIDNRLELYEELVQQLEAELQEKDMEIIELKEHITSLLKNQNHNHNHNLYTT